MRTRSTLFLALLLARQAVAADSAPPTPEPRAKTDTRIAKAVARWRHLGSQSTARVVQTLCSNEDRQLAKAAESELRRVGLPAVEALLHPKNDECEWSDPTVLLAQILCQTAPLDAAALERLLAQVAPLLTTEKSKPGSNLWHALGSIFPAQDSRRPPLLCPNRQALATALAKKVLNPTALTSVPRSFRFDFATLLPDLLSATSPPKDPAAYVPLLARFIDDDPSPGAGAYVRTLGTFGASAAPALPSLHRRLVQETQSIEKSRNTKSWAAVSGGTLLTSLARTVAAIGPAARDVTDDLRKAFVQEVEHVCGWEASEDAGALLQALATLDPTTWTGIKGPTEHAWKALEHCQERSAPSPLAASGEAGQSRLMAGIAAFGPQSKSFAPLLRPLLNSPRSSFAVRAQSARTLERIGAVLEGPEHALAAVLVARLARQEKESAAHREGPAPAPTEVDAAKAALQALHACQEDASLGHRADARIDDLLAFTYEEHHRFAGCVAARICGPSAKDLAETLAVCCPYAYATTTPPYCR